MSERDGTGKNVALNRAAPDRAEKLHLFLLLNAFGDGGHAECAGHLHNAFNHGALAGRTLGVAEKGDVQLEHVERDLLKHVERRVPRAEIVHRTAEPTGRKGRHQLTEQREVTDHHRLGALKLKHSGIDTVLVTDR